MKLLLSLIFVFAVGLTYSDSFAQIPGMEEIPGMQGIGGTEFPSDYPSDMPKPKITMSLGSFLAENGKMFNFESDLTVMDALKFFQDEMPKNGYEQINKEVIMDNISGASAGLKKGSTEVTLMIKADDDKKNIAISILYK